MQKAQEEIKATVTVNTGEADKQTEEPKEPNNNQLSKSLRGNFQSNSPHFDTLIHTSVFCIRPQTIHRGDFIRGEGGWEIYQVSIVSNKIEFEIQIFPFI